MTINKEIEAFRKITEDLLDIEIENEGSFGLLAPRALCATAIHELKRGSFLTDGDIFLLNREFMSILDKKNVSVSQKNRDYFLGKNLSEKKNRDWITEEVKKGAYGHEKNQPRDAY